MARKSAVTQWRDWMGEFPSSRMCRAHVLLAGLNENAHYRMLRARGWGEPNKMYMRSLWPLTLMVVGPCWLVAPHVLSDDYSIIYDLAAAILFLFSFLYLTQIPYRASGFRRVHMPTSEMMVDYHLANISPQMIIAAIWGAGLSPTRIRALIILAITGMIGGIAPAFDHSEYAASSRWFVLTISCVYLGMAPSLPWPMLFSVQALVRKVHERKQMKERPLIFGKEILFRILILPLIALGISFGIMMFFVISDWLNFGGADTMDSHSQAFYTASYLIYVAIALFVGLVLGKSCFTFSGIFLGNSHDRIVELFQWGGVETLAPLTANETEHITYSPSRGKHYGK